MSYRLYSVVSQLRRAGADEMRTGAYSTVSRLRWAGAVEGGTGISVAGEETEGRFQAPKRGAARVSPFLTVKKGGIGGAFTRLGRLTVVVG